ncbi:hypothetical protein DFP72DRAFT_901986 [Ephemerocybe angulata]|uniref:Uncharacterized protein n=1 Tax=Ephemerocybe angulata TaxID=980116 RepID=A0A8H6HWA9_9AGAR|nr:hypothetical protein DFP72DRAFT_901986 [Tulosesus angulatus]
MATSRQVCLTIPTAHGIQVAIEHLYRDTVLGHAKITSLVFLFLAFQPRFPFNVIQFFLWEIPKAIITGFLSCLGFDREGVREGSLASYHQARYHGGYLPAGGLFSSYQSYGATQGGGVVRVFELEVEHESAFWGFMRWICFGFAVYFALL